MRTKNFASAMLLLCVSTVTVWAGGTKEPESYTATPPAEVNVTELAAPVVVPVRPEENPKVTLTVDQAVEYALANSESLKSALIDLEIKRRAKQYTWNVIVPTVQATGTLARSTEGKSAIEKNATEYEKLGTALSNPAVTGMGTAFRNVADGMTEKDNWALACNITASLNLNAALIEGIKVTRMNYESGLLTWEQTRKQTEVSIRKMFYNVLVMQRRLVLQKESLETARSRMIQAQTNYQNGLVPELSYLQAQVAYENQRPAVLQMEQGLQQQIDNFCLLLGYPLGTKLTLEGSVEHEFIEFDSQSLAAKYTGSRLDVLMLQKNIDVMRSGLAASRLQSYTPSLALSASWAPTYAPIFNSGSWKNNDADALSVSATLAFNITGLLPFSSTAQAIKNSEANIAKMQYSLSMLLQRGELEIYTLINSLEKSAASIKVSRASIALAQKAYNQTVAGFNAGTQELLSVKDSEAQLNQAKLGLMSEQLNYMSGLLDLAYALNTDISQLQDFAINK